MKDRVVIIGAGQAGARAALALRAEGFTGAITLIGEEAHLPYERPPLSKEVLLGEAEAGAALIDTAAAYDALAIALRLGVRVERIAPDARALLLANGSREAFDHLVFATGVRPRPLDVTGGTRALTLRTADDAGVLRRRLVAGTGDIVIIGGGFIGLEVAASARQLGWRVTVIEQAPACLGRVLPPSSVAPLIALHAGKGVEILCGVTVAEITETRVRIADGRSLPADLVVAGVGSLPNAELAQAAGMAVSNGILIDEQCRASLPGTYAIGDVACAPNDWFGAAIRLESWDNAERQARQLARTIARGEVLLADPPWFWTDQFDCNLQVIGAPAADDALIVRPGGRADAFIHFYRRGDRISGAVLFNSGRERRAITRLIAAGLACRPDDLADPQFNLRLAA